MFTVPHATTGSFENAVPTALPEALERDTRTVRWVSIPVHGAAGNLSASLPQPANPAGADTNGVPRRRLHRAPRRPTVGVQPTPGPGRCVQ